MSLNHREDGCFICGQYPTERHEVFFGRRNRQKAIDDDLVVYLCRGHHRYTAGVHGRDGKELNLMLKKLAQKEYEKTHSRDEFRSRYGKSYL